MKKYICLNSGECNWADEIPPREFSLNTVDLNCPNCEKANIREVEEFKSPITRLLPFIAGAVLLLGVILYIWLNKTGQQEGGSTESTGGEGTTVVGGGSGPGPETATTNSGGREGQNGNTVEPPVKPEKTPITWTMVEGSGFCDPDLNGTFLYTERNNLGQIRERKVMNKAGCYPANN